MQFFKRSENDYFIAKWTNYTSFLGRIVSKIYLILDLYDFEKKFPNLILGKPELILRTKRQIKKLEKDDPGISDHMKPHRAIKLKILNIAEHPELKKLALDSGQMDGW